MIKGNMQTRQKIAYTRISATGCFGTRIALAGALYTLCMQNINRLPCVRHTTRETT
ncbi:hypothetical protein EMEDMD4_490175 [Sinorhizobium medicae]|uniref:Uncharacterized protein n=1 Tax=Sinorhizobium medicae TaxID=110321 RepID=A0A508X191_9HYPH|nr:hypothetical protein EMEDMD4_490175 [Sinorhizobium medicae]